MVCTLNNIVFLGTKSVDRIKLNVYGPIVIINIYNSNNNNNNNR